MGRPLGKKRKSVKQRERHNVWNMNREHTPKTHALAVANASRCTEFSHTSNDRVTASRAPTATATEHTSC